MCGYWPFASFRCYATFVGYHRQSVPDLWGEDAANPEITRGCFGGQLCRGHFTRSWQIAESVVLATRQTGEV